MFVTGTFDDWGKTVKLDRKGDVFEKQVHLPVTGDKVHFKVCHFPDRTRAHDTICTFAPVSADGRLQTTGYRPRAIHSTLGRRLLNCAVSDDAALRLASISIDVMALVLTSLPSPLPLENYKSFCESILV